MASLSVCLSKAMSGLTKEDVADVKAAYKDFMDDNYPGGEAAILAAKAVLEQAIADRSEIVRQIVEAGGVAPDMPELLPIVKKSLEDDGTVEEIAGKAKVDDKEEATTLGANAFADGKSRTPALNKDLQELIGKNNGRAMEIMEAYTKAWDQANLAAPVEGIEPRITTEKTGQTSLVPEATTKEKIAAEAKAKEKRGGNEPMDVGMFGSEKDQTDLVDMAKKPAKSPVVVDGVTGKDAASDALAALSLGELVDLDKRYKASGYDRSLLPDGVVPMALIEEIATRRMNGDTAAKAQAEDAPRTESVTGIDAIRDRLLDQGFEGIVEARKFVKEQGIDGTNKEIDEAIETAVVAAARQTVAEGGKPSEIYKAMVGIYDRQPNLGVRTSTSVSNQAYSTPMPLAYLASRLAGVKAADRVYEPTAGNGALLIEADPANVIANELEPGRAAALRKQGFATVKSLDATEPDVARDKSADSVIMNPPFGAVRDGGQSKTWTVDGLTTTAIDHAIALNALHAMTDDGKAVLILGGIKAESNDERRAGYRGQSKRKFFAKLYKTYNVTDHFTVSGDLYKKQGAGWPVDVVVIDGRGASSRALPAAEPPQIFNSWAELEGKLPNANTASGAKEETVGHRQPNDDAPGTKPEPKSGNADRGETAVQRRPERLPAGTKDNAVPVRGDGDRGKSTDVRTSSDDANSDATKRDRVSGRVDRPAAPKQRERITRREPPQGSGQALYTPTSNATSLDTLVPVNMAAATKSALDRVTKRHGDLDAFVADRLGYDEDLSKYYSAEQIDALATAIDNVERGAGYIIGDQTGIGKGRFVAGMIRYAIRKGWTPVFVTEKPDLYGDMFRDMTDIGMSKMLGREPHAFMTNTGENVPLDDEALAWKQEADQARADGLPIPKRRGRFLVGGGKSAQEVSMREIASGKPKHDIVFTTYDQMNTQKQQETDRRNFLRAIAPNSMIILDESHNAGGQGEKRFAKKSDAPDRAQLARELVKNAAGVVYSSATFAKRPDVMDLYARTDMGKAVDDPKLLPALIQRGGVPMQQIVATMLSDAGQYMRRERSFEGVEYAVVPVPVDLKTYGQFSDAVRAVFEFDLMIEETRAEFMENVLDQMGATQAKDAGVGTASANSTAFASIMHNIVNQMILSIKADQVATRAIEALNAGEKPVIAVANTMESFITDYADDSGIAVNDPIDITFGDVMQRYLDRTLRITIKDADNKINHIQIPIKSLPSVLQKKYADAKALIRDGDFDAMPVSPIDWIRHRLTKAGYSIAEVTGRKNMIDYGAGKVPKYIVRQKKEMGPSGKRSSIAAFNRGDLDALILNRSGSTGVSMHASSKFKDQSLRHMIIAQAEGNIDTHLQMLGRVHRTGQIRTPRYSQIAAEIPAEARPTAVLMKKMASLNANTTGARGSVFMADSVDFMNEYGDKVVANIIMDEPDINAMLGSPLKENDKGIPLNEDAARRVTGRLVLLSPKDQADLLNRIQDEYKAEIERLDALGENALEAKTVDLQARVLDTTPLTDKTGDGPFLDSAQIEKVSVKAQGRAMAPNEVVEAISEFLEVSKPEGGEAAALANLERLGRDWINKKVGDVRSRATSWIADDVAAKSEDARISTKIRNDEQLKRWVATAQTSAPGSRVTLDLGERQIHGIVLSVERKGKAKNPVALGAWSVTIAVPDSVKTFTFPMSKLFPPSVTKSNDESGATIKPSPVPFTGLISQLNDARREGREERYIVTGNILGGYEKVHGKGQIVNFTMEDGSLRPGIFMSRDFALNKFMDTRTVRLRSADQIVEFLKKVPIAEVRSSDKFVTLANRRGDWVIETASGRATGGRYYTDSKVREALGSNEFQRSGGVMRANLNQDAFVRVVDAIRKLGALFETTESQDVAQEIVRASTPVEEAPAEPASTASVPTAVTPASKSTSTKITEFGKSVDALKEQLGVKTKKLNLEDDIQYAISGNAVATLRDQVLAMKRGSRVQVISEHAAKFAAEADMIIGTVTDADIEIEGASIEDLKSFVVALADLGQVIEAKTQQGYSLSEDVQELRDVLSSRMSEYDDQITELHDDADAIADSASDRIEEIDERIDELSDDSVEESDVGDNSEDETPVHLPGEISPEDSILDIVANEIVFALTVVSPMQEQMKQLEAKNIDDLDLKQLTALRAEADRLQWTALRAASWYKEIGAVVSDGIDKVYYQIDEIVDKQITPATDKLEDASHDISDKLEEAHERLIDQQEMEAGQIVDLNEVHAGPTLVRDRIDSWTKWLDAARSARDLAAAGRFGEDAALPHNLAGRDSEIGRVSAQLAEYSESLAEYEASKGDGVLAAISGRGVKSDVDGLGYYSGALRAAYNLRQEKGTPEQMLAMLKKEGAKQAEITATGLDKFFESKTGSSAGNGDAKGGEVTEASQTNGDRSGANTGTVSRLKQPSITKDDIIKYLEQNRIKLNQVIKERGSNAAAIDAEVEEQLEAWKEELYNEAVFDEYRDRDTAYAVDQSADRWRKFAEDNGIAIDNELFDANPEKTLRDAGIEFSGGVIPIWKATDVFLFGKLPNGKVGLYNPNSGFEVIGDGDIGNAIENFEAEALSYIKSDIINAEAFDKEQEIRERVEEKLEGIDSTKFSKYSLDPTNSTYRETILHLPVKMTGLPIIDVGERRGVWWASVRTKSGTGTSSSYKGGFSTEAEARAWATATAAEGKSIAQDTFRSNHFPEPNIIAHARTQILTTPDGRKTLNVDELQSDEGSKVRDKGVRDEAKIKDIDTKLAKAIDKLNEVDADAMRLSSRMDRSFAVGLRTKALRDIGTPESIEVANRLADASDEARLLNEEMNTLTAGAIGHPLVNTTDQWTTTAFRRLIRMAVEEGADAIAITPGSVQKQRYSLSTMVDELRYDAKTKTLDGKFQGQAIIAKTVPVEELPNYIGKDIAQKLTAPGWGGQWHAVKDMEIGGEGMTATYDVMYPRTLGKILAKIDPSIKAEKTSLRRADGRVIEQSMSPSEAIKQGFDRIPALEFPIFRITEKVRQAVMKDGQPLFAARSKPISFSDVEDAIYAGETYVVPADHVATQISAITPMRGMAPANAYVGVLEKIEPVQNDSIDPANQRVILHFKDSGGAKKTLRMKLASLANYRAIALGSSSASPAVLLFNIDTVGIENIEPGLQLRKAAGGQAWHEIFHILRNQGLIGRDSWGRLLGHANKLRVLDYPVGKFLEMVGQQNEPVISQSTLRQEYSRLYAGRDDKVEVMRQEAITHMLELWHHGAISDAEMAPVRDILEDIRTGRVSGNSRVAVKNTHETQPAFAINRLYHSTPNKFDRFENRFTDEVGFHFGSKSQAHNRAYIMSNGNLWKYFRNWRDVPVEVDITNPITLSNDPGSFMPTALAKQLVKDRLAPLDLIAAVHDAQLGPNGSPEAAKAVVRDYLVSKGYDAIRYPNFYEDTGGFSYMTFGTGNVKHARTGDVLYGISGRNIKSAGDRVINWMRWAENLQPTTSKITDRKGKSYTFERHPRNGTITYVVKDGKKEVGSFYVRTGGSVFESVSVMNARVSSEYQRRGIATAAYDAIEADLVPGGVPLYPQGSMSLSRDGRAFWEARNPGKVQEMLDAEKDRFRMYGQTIRPTIDDKAQAGVKNTISDAIEIVQRIAGTGVKVEFRSAIPTSEILARATDQSTEARARGMVGQSSGGFYAPKTLHAEALIGLSTGALGFDLKTSAGHEAWHHVETVLATDAEYRLLSSPSEMSRMRGLAAKELELESEDTIMRAMPDYEVRAYAFQRYRKLREDGITTPGLHMGIRRLFDRLIEIFRGVQNALRGQGFDSFESIFERGRTGKLAAREAGRPDAAPSVIEGLVKKAFVDAANANPDTQAHVGAFTRQRLAQADGESVTATEAYEAYIEWADEAGVAPATLDEFSRGMSVDGISSMKIAGSKRYIGVRLAEENERKAANPDEVFEKDAFAIARDAALGFSFRESVERQIERLKAVVGEKPELGRIANLDAMLGTIANDNAVDQEIYDNVLPMFESNAEVMGNIIPENRPAPANRTGSVLGRNIRRTLTRAADMSDRARVNIQDKVLPIRRLAVERVENETGTKVPLSLDTYVAEALYHGRAGERMNDLKADVIEPLIELLRKSEITADDLGDYLYARHARERNDAIQLIDPENDMGSGMTNKEADAILAKWRSSGKQNDMESAAAMIDEITEDARKTLLKAGLIDRETFDTWSQKYAHYVPLRGFEMGVDESPARIRSGWGFDVRGPETMQALGRRSKADNPVMYAILQAQQAIVRAEKNRVNKTLYRMIQANPNPAVWQIYKGESRRRINPTTGFVEEYWVLPPFVRNDSVHGVKINGKQTWMELRHPSLARAMRGVGPDIQGTIIGRTLMTLTRTYASLLTSYNPEFMVSNFFRDVETAILNSLDTEGGSKGMRAQIVKDAVSLKAIRGAYNALRGNAEGEYARWFEEYRLAGGRISFMEFNDVERIKRRINSSLKAGKMRRALSSAAQYVEDINSAVENGVRLSTYIALRKAGVEKDRAAFTARELTVNFNRKGEWGPGINAAYLFFNASVQGTTRVAQAMVKSKAVRYAVGGVFATGMALDLLNYIIAGDDDNDKNRYDQITEWVRDRNIIIMNPFGKGDYIMIPMAYGYNTPYLAGQELARMGRGKSTPLQAAARISSTVVDAINPMGTNPLGAKGSFWQFVSPTLLDPGVQVLENKNWHGGPIQPKKFDNKKPDSENSFGSAPWWAVDLARWMNKTTGGNVGRSGYVDISPEVIEHYVEFAGGGVAKFISNAINTGGRLVHGEEWLPEKAPFIRRLYGKETVESRRREFYEVWDDVDRAEYEVKQLQKTGDRDAATIAREKYAPELRVYGQMKGAKETLKALRGRVEKIQANDSITRSDRDTQLNEIREREKALIAHVLKSYHDAQKPEKPQ